jgi:hypothetical protein
VNEAEDAFFEANSDLLQGKARRGTVFPAGCD